MCNSCNTKAVLFLTAVIALLQIIHLILLNHLDTLRFQRGIWSRHRKEPPVSPEIDVVNLFTAFEDSLRNDHSLDTTGSYRITTVLQSGQNGFSLWSSPIPDVTLVTHCSYRHLFRIVDLSQRWAGHISLAVFVEEDAVADALYEAAILLACHRDVRDNFTLSFVSPVPAKTSPTVLIPDQRHRLDNFCSTLGGNKYFQNYASIDYPNNLLRNVGRRACTTEFVFVVDVDMLPNINFRMEFLLFAAQRGLFRRNRVFDKNVFVVAAFEAIDSVKPPYTKSQLLSLVETREVRPFYSQICAKCQAQTNYDAWLSEPPGAELSPLFNTLWKDPWEPFYVASNNVPLYDERFKQYGFNRISQACELHVAGYSFSVLNNAFLVHRGFKTSSDFHDDKEKELESNRALFRQFKAELKYKYVESSRRC